mmetsp:Transcript_10399/g.26182  ORF Transcript_10399/g.26182 Transcript_10399/m.26182 type:complete len:297 (-) Transcript_10399:226-1116(-)
MAAPSRLPWGGTTAQRAARRVLPTPERHCSTRSAARGTRWACPCATSGSPGSRGSTISERAAAWQRPHPLAPPCIAWPNRRGPYPRAEPLGCSPPPQPRCCPPPHAPSCEAHSGIPPGRLPRGPDCAPQMLSALGWEPAQPRLLRRLLHPPAAPARKGRVPPQASPRLERGRLLRCVRTRNCIRARTYVASCWYASAAASARGAARRPGVPPSRTQQWRSYRPLHLPQHSGPPPTRACTPWQPPRTHPSCSAPVRRGGASPRARRYRRPHRCRCWRVRVQTRGAAARREARPFGTD